MPRAFGRSRRNKSQPKKKSSTGSPRPTSPRSTSHPSPRIESSSPRQRSLSPSPRSSSSPKPQSLSSPRARALLSPRTGSPGSPRSPRNTITAGSGAGHRDGRRNSGTTAKSRSRKSSRLNTAPTPTALVSGSKNGSGTGASSSSIPASAAAVLGNSAQYRELEELLLKLEELGRSCVEEKLEEEKKALKDEFVALTREMCRLLYETKELIRVRHEIQTERGNTVDVIQKGSQINKRLEELDAKFAKMKEVFRKQAKQCGKKFTEAQLDERFAEMQIFKQQIEEAKSLFRNAAKYSEMEIKTLTDFKSQMKRQGLAGSQGVSEYRELTGEEHATIDAWKARDAEIDKQILEIGDAVDRLNDIAIQIGERVDKQTQLIGGLRQQADQANESLVNINSRVKTLLGRKGSMNFFCKLILAFILIGLIGYIISMINRRIVG